AHRDGAAIDRRLADTEIRPVMADARARHHLERGGGAAHHWMIAEEGPGMAEEAARRLRHQAERREDVIMCLIGLVQHERHSVRCSGKARARDLFNYSVRAKRTTFGRCR